MVYRAWYAIQNSLTVTRTGEEVRGVYGFLQMFRKAIDTYKPTYIALTLDRPTPTFRHIKYQDYKAHRPKSPQELHDQFPHVRRLMETFKVPIFELDGFEADDLIGTLAAQSEDQDVDVLILTGDTDALQLVSPKVRVILQYRMGEQLIFDEARVRERYGGLSPSQLIHYKALRGDPADNIPGIPGVGEKTAIKLLKEFGSVENIYDNLSQIPEKQRDVLAKHTDTAFQGLDLVTIVRDVPVTLDLEASKWGQFNRQEVVQFLQDMEFFSQVSWVPLGIPSADTTPRPRSYHENSLIIPEYVTVQTYEQLTQLCIELKASSGFAFDVETAPEYPEVRGVDPMRSSLVGLSISIKEGQGFYIPIGHTQGEQISIKSMIDGLKKVFESESIPKVAHHANYDATVLGNYGIFVKNITFDTLLAGHLLGHRPLGLKGMALNLLGVEMTDITELIGTGRSQLTMADVSIDRVAPYACADADMTYRLWGLLQKQIDTQGFSALFRDVEMPLVPVLVAMQMAGITIDSLMLDTMAHDLGERLQLVEGETYDLVGHKFNINSPSQLGEVLFSELRLNEIAQTGRPKRTRTGSYSTDATILDGLKGSHPIIDLILENRQLSKLKSTYVTALPILVHHKTGRVHTSYNQAGSVTGRISSNEPNLQNIPIRTKLGRQIRVAFRPGSKGWVLLAADYSQIELRVLAHLSQDEGLLVAFQNDLDIHSATAAQVFQVPLTEVTADQRRLAKVLNFGVIYGISPYGISQQTGLSFEAGSKFIRDYNERYPGIHQYIEITKGQARDKGYVETLLGRRRPIPDIHSSNHNLRQAAEREAINMPVQGTASEVMKIAMIAIHNRLQESALGSRMLLQVHDELIFESPTDDLDDLTRLVLESMPNAMKLDVPLKVTVKTGSNWGDLE
jgi:DNA polymerase-1